MPGIAERGSFFLQKLLHLIYPRACIHCNLPLAEGRSNLPFCPGCWGTLRLQTGPHCPICATPFSSPSALLHSPDHHCGECREHPPAFSRAITPYAYEGVLADAIQRFKYQKQTSLADPLARLWVETLTTAPFDRVTAIPLHPARLRTREFNQSLLLAQKIARLIRVPLLIDGLSRSRDTLPQVGLSRKEREQNVRRAFYLSNPIPIREKRILLVDDVYTTGATLREGAKTLLKGGAKEVIVAAIARMI
ncbi:MAG: ComF family protein [Candidatus Manganitrophaceae bacterium]|nr:MAG: ComF family protein [Candidatus Manganitrophaceae bacterium]